ncbi:hypothetical protein VSS74_31110, partial [Conexibacter stalactiti]
MQRRVRGPRVAACLAAAALTFACAVTAALSSAAPARAASDTEVAAAVQRAVAWLHGRQHADGSFGVNSGLDPAWALLGIAGAGVHPADLRHVPAGGGAAGPSAQDGQLQVWTVNDPADWWAFTDEQATDWERAILQAHAAGLHATRLSPQRNMLAGLAAWYRDGWFTSQTSVLNHTIFGLLALSALPVPDALRERTARVVERNQHDDGGYTSYPATDPATRAGRSDVDSTGAAIGALCAAGRTPADSSVAGGISFLRTTRAQGGAIGNVNSTSWALDGLGECGIRRGAAGWTAEDEKTVDWLLAAQATSGPDAGAWTVNGSANEYATADALRALSAAAFVVGAPPRANPADPRLRPVPDDADGTVVPVALVVDPGHGDARLCATDAPVGATVAQLLEAARLSSRPAGCIASLTFSGGLLKQLDGIGVTGAGGWRASLHGGAESAAGPQRVGFGDIVAVRLEDHSPLQFDVSAIAFGAQPEGFLGAPRAATLRNVGDVPVRVAALRVGGEHAGDFVLSTQECVGETLAPGEQCGVRLRFGPGAGGERRALLSARLDGFDWRPQLALSGTGGPLPSGPPGGAGGIGAAGA